ncbi:LamG domain-containing protein [Candidatus Bathyarchaeota archaeon]|nr:LamG domain-containing protein [Candidatus Bathyarchaeota archaeon]
MTLTYDRSLQNGNIKFYVNGTLDSEHDHTVSIRHKDQQLNIGTYVDDYAGLIDEVRIWNVARTQSEIQETMMRTLDETEVTTPNLVGYWRFDEGTGINSKDFSIYGNDATLLNDIEWYSPGVSIIPEFSNISIIIICALIVIPVAIIKRKINKDT